MYNRYEIVMEYAKRPRLPPPFVVISYIGMVISSCSRQCVLKLKQYSDKKKANAPLRSRTQLSSLDVEIHHDNDNSRHNPNVTTPLVSAINNTDLQNQLNDTSTEIIVDDSFLGRLLNCKPCRQVTDNQKHKKVCI